MKQTTLKIALVAFAAALAATSRADISINQNASLYGYAAGSLRHDQRATGDNSDTTMDLDAAKLGLAFSFNALNFRPVTGKLSLFTQKDNDGHSKVHLLEANGTYDFFNGWTITAGRFQSWLGYEPFDIPNNNFITNGSEIAGLIPNFHEGAKIEYKLDKASFGIALLDSIYNGENAFSGDGSFSDGCAIEARAAYTDGGFSAQATLGWQNSRDGQFLARHAYIGDLWAQYTVGKTTIGAEFFYRHDKEMVDDEGNASTYYFLVSLKHQFTEKVAGSVRATYGKQEEANYGKLSVSAACALTENLGVGAEISYSKYNKTYQAAYDRASDNIFAGVQACFKF